MTLPRLLPVRRRFSGRADRAAGFNWVRIPLAFWYGMSRLRGR